MSVIVIKLGGSLMRSVELSAFLKRIELLSKKSNIVIVPGGGEFADSVRSLQKCHGFDDHTAHRLALLAMCQYGYFLAGMNPKLQIIKNMDVLLSSMGTNVPLVWLPIALIEDDSEIAATWDFTSDSISLWLATKLSATKLVLIKSKAPVGSDYEYKKLIKDGYLDKGFQWLIDNYSGELLIYGKNQLNDFIGLN